MDDSDNEDDTTDKATGGTRKSSRNSAESFVMNNEPDANWEHSDGAEPEDESGGSPVTDEELERQAEQLETEVRRLKNKEKNLKQMLADGGTEERLKNKLNFYKFSGLYVLKCTDNKLHVDLTPTLLGKHSEYYTYYIIYRIISNDCYEVEKSHLPCGIEERLGKERVSFNELRRHLDYLQHVCTCVELKIKQIREAEKQVAGDTDVSHTIFMSDIWHIEVVFRPTDEKCSLMWLTVLLLYNDKEIFYEPERVKTQSEGFTKEAVQRVRELFVDAAAQELKFTVLKAKNFISTVLQESSATVSET